MSYGLMAYSVNIDDLRAACGSGDDFLRRAISGRFKSRIASTNQQLGYSNERGEPSVFLAIRQLILQEEKTLNGTLYAYGFKYIVEYFGTFLDNNLFYPCSLDFLTQEIDSQLVAARASVRMSDLVYYDAPVDFPTPDDFPMYGYWPAHKVALSVEPLKGYSSTLPELQAVQAWLELAAERNEGIVGYYH